MIIVLIPPVRYTKKNYVNNYTYICLFCKDIICMGENSGRKTYYKQEKVTRRRRI